jgi:cation diffusion facilitator CzcD-associated flavoprotein CzcO
VRIPHLLIRACIPAFRIRHGGRTRGSPRYAGPADCRSGAGPAGLVAAKNLIHNTTPGTFKVTIFDGQPRLGGLWPESPTDNSGLIHPLMITNQSKHTVQFSDFSYKPYVQQLPRAWQVGEYLKEYSSQYLDSRPDVEIRYSSRVEKADPVQTGNGNGNGNGWRVRVKGGDGGQSESSHSEERTFDYLLVASGYFGKPVVPNAVQDARPTVPIVHSSKYRDLKSLLGENGGKGGKILVVGGQMSGVEIAGTIATHISSAVNGLGESPIPNPDKYTVHHLVQRPIWVFPTYTTPLVGAYMRT